MMPVFMLVLRRESWRGARQIFMIPEARVSELAGQQVSVWQVVHDVSAKRVQRDGPNVFFLI
jgi:hypothetical protein